MLPCSLLVPSDANGGIPLKISAGIVINPPPPASVSRNPAKTAMKNKNESSSVEKCASSNWYSFFRLMLKESNSFSARAKLLVPAFC